MVIIRSLYAYSDTAVAERDAVNRLLTENTVKTGYAEHSVIRAELFSDVELANQTTQQDKKPGVTKKNFLKGMETLFLWTATD